MNSYITANYIKDGVINSEKIAEDFKTAEDFRKVERIIEPHLQEAREKVREIFVRADQALELVVANPKVPSVSPKAVEAMHLADEKIIDVKKDYDSKSWVDEVADGKKSRGNSDEMIM